MDKQRQVELKILQEEKEQLQNLLLRQTVVIGQLEQQLIKVSSNNTVLQRQQQELLDTVNNLIHSISLGSFRGHSTLWVIPTSFQSAPHFLLLSNLKKMSCSIESIKSESRKRSKSHGALISKHYWNKISSVSKIT